MSRPTALALIGAGRVATALGVLLERSGRQVVAATGRAPSRERVARFLPGAQFFDEAHASEAASRADVVIIGVSDDAIESVAASLAAGGGFRSGHFVVHLSGSVGLEALAPAKEAGAEVLSTHPLQSFPTVERGLERFPGSGMAVTATTDSGFEVGEAIARDCGANPFRLANDLKSLYHAAAVFAANYLATVEAVAEELFRSAGLAEPVPLFSPLASAVLDRTMAEGPANALTGPAVRGDVGTVRRNLEALAQHAPTAVPAYIALARMALDIAHGVPDDRRSRVEQELERWK